MTMARIISTILLAMICLTTPAQKVTRFMMGISVSGKVSQFESKLKELGFEAVSGHFFYGNFHCSMAMAIFDTFDRWMSGKEIAVFPVTKPNSEILAAVGMVIPCDTADAEGRKQLFMDTCTKLHDGPFYEFMGTYNELVYGMDEPRLTYVQKDIHEEYDSDEFKMMRIVQVGLEQVGVTVMYINGWNLKP